MTGEIGEVGEGIRRVPMSLELPKEMAVEMAGVVMMAVMEY